ncbi:DUF3304 domain-containing protein [Chromobacterium subtsugae]|uniref:DUF3304 domain-containing protein n=1 Tax=Chromobacterium subtsugae TaxID=251747 RepID=A0ABS7FCK8_9NEIS|nr:MULTISPECIES: DUF3304 domain-containing protein [Chromobacterium]MBW7566445.1 DUF3304 domain-containing protein [Chromobacterium subtsugae]MBW8287696.1 DUF3304 domain-containing protein [Chromobacterium subtsugae]WSE91028.1 DUF3304 domain-containing protein [Chromobacterium subtsugae]WVH59402.1 DUF3304 domain-containing protein [Chromobacterium subtsugae]
MRFGWVVWCLTLWLTGCVGWPADGGGYIVIADKEIAPGEIGVGGAAISTDPEVWIRDVYFNGSYMMVVNRYADEQENADVYDIRDSKSFNGSTFQRIHTDTCCYGLPRQWRPGLQALVEWTQSPARPGWQPQAPTPHRVLLNLPKYDDPASLRLVFLPCGDLTAVIDYQLRARVFLTDPPKGPAELARRLGGRTRCEAGG